MNSLITQRFVTVLCAACLVTGCREPAQPAPAPLPAAEVIYAQGNIYTGAGLPGATALAVADGRILAVGAADQVEQTANGQTRRVDLAGQFVMPGIIDGHAHPAWGGVTASYYCLFPATALPNEVAETISACVAQAAEDERWIQGGLWAADFFTQYQIESPRAWLDGLSAGKAIALKDDSGHNYWVNSTALELLGLDAGSVPPAGAVFGRQPDGELNGVLIESFGLLADKLPPWTVDHYRTGVRYAVANAHRYGITGFKDASATETEVQAYFAADQAGELKVNVAACLYTADEDMSVVDVAGYRRMRDAYRSSRVHTNFVKIFLDGIPTTSRTAAMVEPYVTVSEEQQPIYGEMHLSQADLARVMTELDAAGFTVKIHAAGDRSVHTALNAIDAARAANGGSNRRHEIAHAGFVLDADIPRFAQLNVVADLSPHLWFPSPIVASVRAALGDRGMRYWPNRSLLDSGAPLLMGSDWPAVAPDLNPWIGLEALITRTDPAAAYPGTGWREQALSLEQGLQIMTMGGARALGLADQVGTLEAGKWADFVVLNQDLFAIPPQQISETLAVATYFQGERVYSLTANSGMSGQSDN